MTSPTDLANRRTAMKLRALCVTACAAHIDAIARIDRDWPSGAQSLVEQLDRIEDSIAEPPRLKRLPHSKGVPPMTDDKPSVPERIWCEIADIFDDMGFWQTAPHSSFTEYTRSDMIPPPVSRDEVGKIIMEAMYDAYSEGQRPKTFGIATTPFTDRIMALIEGRKP